jgi:hypothetical protein
MPKKTPGEYFTSKGISPRQLVGHLEQLYPLEREVLLARALGETLRVIGGRIGLTPEGVRQAEIRALRKLREGDATAQARGHSFRLAVEHRFRAPLEAVIKGLPEPEAALILAYARGEPVAALAPKLGLSIAGAAALRDRTIARLLGEERGSRASEWVELKAAVVEALRESSLTYDDLEARFPMSRRRLMKLMLELVNEGQAELTDEYPFRFVGVKPA